MGREVVVERKTNETDIKILLNLDGTGNSNIKTSIPFFDHMLSQIAKHGFFDLEIKAKGDTEIDFHHTVEDTGIALGEAFAKALGDKSNIRRYGFSATPLNETLVNVTIDICGRSFFVYHVTIPKTRVGNFDVELIEEFLNGFAMHSGTTLHVNLVHGTNMHHIAEAIFKSLGRALDCGTSIDERVKGILSTKGKLL